MGSYHKVSRNLQPWKMNINSNWIFSREDEDSEIDHRQSEKVCSGLVLSPKTDDFSATFCYRVMVAVVFEEIQ